jgi:hypothetical protein
MQSRVGTDKASVTDLGLREWKSENYFNSSGDGVG